MFNFTKTERVIKPAVPFIRSSCDSCGEPLSYDGNIRVALDGLDATQIKLMIPVLYICKDCAERLHQQLGDILGHTPNGIETASRVVAVDKFIAESDLLEVTFPDGTIIRATKFSEDLEDE